MDWYDHQRDKWHNKMDEAQNKQIEAVIYMEHLN